MQCEWDKAWIGRCKDDAAPEHRFCPQHQHKCASCGGVANHDCDATVGPLVCGIALCPKCAHDWGGPKNGWDFNHHLKLNILCPPFPYEDTQTLKDMGVMTIEDFLRSTETEASAEEIRQRLSLTPKDMSIFVEAAKNIYKREKERA